MMKIEDIKNKVEQIMTEIPGATVGEALKVLELILLSRRTN